jgi:hypothetical protein
MPNLFQGRHPALFSCFTLKSSPFILNVYSFLLKRYDLDTRVLPDDILEALDGQCPSCVLVRSARPIKVFKVTLSTNRKKMTRLSTVFF